MAQKYELATAYVSILPSMKGLSEETTKAAKEASKSFSSALGGVGKKAGAALARTFGEGGVVRSIGGKLSSGILGALGNVGRSGSGILLRGLAGVGKSIGTTIFNGAKSGIASISSSLSSGLKSAVSVGMAGIGAGVGAIAAQTLGGGLNRALDVNSATAKLEAFGYEAKEIEKIMNTVSDTVSGTRFTTPEALQTTNKLLASGVKPGAEMEKILQNTVKLADMAGSDFNDMGTIMSQAYGSGVIQADELNQILDRGVGITAYLAQEMGVAQSEVKKLGSEGKISFQDLMNAVEAVDFDSSVLAAKDARLAFSNLRSVFSQWGQKLWTPITDNAAMFFMNLRNGLQEMQKNPAFVAFTEKIVRSIQVMMDKALLWSEKFKSFITDDFNISNAVKQIESFRGAIKGFEPILLGLGAVLGSSLISRIPILGGLLGGLTLPAGILIGIFGYLSKNFEEFGLLLTTIGTKFTEFFQGMKQGMKAGNVADNEDTFVDKVRESLLSLIDFFNKFNFTEIGAKVGTFMTEVMGGLQENVPKIVDSISNLIQKIASVFEGKGTSINGDNLIETITNIIVLLIDKAALLIPIIANIVSAIGSFVTSEFMTTVINAITGLIGFLSKSEGALYVILGVIAAFFINNKFGAPIEKGASIFETIGNVIKGIAKNLGTVLTEFFKGLGMAGKVALQNLPYIAGIAAVLAALVLAFAGVTWLLEKMGFFEVVKDMIGFILEEISGFILKMKPIFELILSTLLEVFDRIVLGIENIIPVIVDGIVKLVEVVMTNLNDFIEQLSTLIIVIAEKGADAGLNAIALAGGLTVLAASLAALTAVGAGNSLVEGVGSLFGKEQTFIGEIISLTEALGKIGDQAKNLPTTLSSLTVDYEKIGSEWNTALFQGFTTNLQTQLTSIRTAVRATMREIQNDLTANPLEIRFKQPVVPSIPSYSGSGNSGRNTTNNTNNIFNVKSVVNNDALNRLIRSSR